MKLKTKRFWIMLLDFVTWFIICLVASVHLELFSWGTLVFILALSIQTVVCILKEKHAYYEGRKAGIEACASIVRSASELLRKARENDTKVDIEMDIQEENENDQN